MKMLRLDLLDDIAADETILFQVKPNPLLYSLEASRAAIIAMSGLSAFMVFVLMLKKGGPLLFLLKLVALLNCIFFSIFVLFVAILARGFSFILTNKNVIIRTTFGNQFGVPLDEIKSVKVRRYGTHYGSVYLDRYMDSLESFTEKTINLDKQPGSAWFSVPRSWPQLMGFLAVNDFNKFASMIVDSRNATRAGVQAIANLDEHLAKLADRR
jgi:hypothetical protein